MKSSQAFGGRYGCKTVSGPDANNPVSSWGALLWPATNAGAGSEPGGLQRAGVWDHHQGRPSPLRMELFDA